MLELIIIGRRLDDGGPALVDHSQSGTGRLPTNNHRPTQVLLISRFHVASHRLNLEGSGGCEWVGGCSAGGGIAEEGLGAFTNSSDTLVLCGDFCSCCCFQYSQRCMRDGSEVCILYFRFVFFVIK